MLFRFGRTCAMARKPKVGFQVEVEDQRAIAAVTALVKHAMPNLGDQSASLVMRAALRIGLEAVAQDPSRATSAAPPAASLVEGWETQASLIAKISHALAHESPESKARAKRK